MIVIIADAIHRVLINGRYSISIFLTIHLIPQILISFTMTTPMSDGAMKHPNPTSGAMSKLTSKFDRLSSNVSRLGTAVKTTLNPNHRHDEEWEKEVDAKIEKIRDGHRFRSFAGERDGE